MDEEKGNATIIVSYKVLKKEVRPPIFIKFMATFTRDYFVEEEESEGWTISDFKLTQFEKLEGDRVLK